MKCKTVTGQAKANPLEPRLGHKTKKNCSEHTGSRMPAKENSGLLDDKSVKGAQVGPQLKPGVFIALCI